ncbi:MAG: putative lipid II flippase FtsW [Candidatus Wildermuthbacteria bacterium]|nr:putative lipid II flippase FtsW [Candidatus Wildermuthbacteria bacterium]
MRKPDFILLSICAALLFLGILILASVSASFSISRTGSTFYYLNHQLLFGVLPGVLLGTIAFFFPLSFLKRWSFALLCIGIILLGMVFIPGVGSNLGGAHRWIFVGPISIQPSELIKFIAILYVAAFLTSRSTGAKNGIKTQRALKELLLPFLGILGVMGILLILQPDLSTLGIIIMIGLAMYFLASTPLWHTLSMIATGTAALFFLVQIAPYRLSRFLVFLNPSLDPLGKGYQIKQALIGIGSGGLTGVGLGLSFQKFGTLPEPISDSIFAIFAEETGFAGAFLLIALFLAFCWRGFVVARRAPDQFSGLVATGIVWWITLQAFINIGAMIRLLPMTGIPLPFISYGGSALVTELIALGILLNISKQKTV